VIGGAETWGRKRKLAKRALAHCGCLCEGGECGDGEMTEVSSVAAATFDDR